MLLRESKFMNISSEKKFFNIRGQALVEFAIILPLLLLLVVGIFEFGRYFYNMNNITNVAREGVRFAVVTPNYTQASVESFVKQRLSAFGYDPTKSTVTVTAKPASGSGNPVTVAVTLPFESIVAALPSDWYFLSFFSFKDLPQVRGSATMRYEQ
jgi:Flp pilus assembly protein TadG